MESKTKEKKISTKAICKLCNEILLRFDTPSNVGEHDGPELSNLIDEVAPWMDLLPEDDPELEKFNQVWNGFTAAFGFGYALGQMVDLPGIDITPIKDLLRKKKALIYMPREKAA